MIPEHLKGLCQRLCEAARKGTLSQSILLVGREGVGKFALVMDVARALLCENGMTACGMCSSCQQMARLYHPDFLLAFPFPNLRPESRKVTVFHFSDPVSSSARFSEETRDELQRYLQLKLEDPFAIADFEKKENIPVEIIKDLIHTLSKRPLRGGRRVVAILDIDKMAFGAADLFLKTVEEPPQNTHLLLTTSRPDLLYPTLLSRLHRIEVPSMPEGRLQEFLERRLGITGMQALYLSRISSGSPGMAVRFQESDVFTKRDMILGFFQRLFGRDKIGLLVTEVQSQYSGSRFKYDETKTDFDIIETIIHDLYMLVENHLDNHLINVDIKEKISGIKSPSREVLDIWSNCCAQTRRACTVNNVAVDTGMVFFYISCFEALENLVRPKFTLP